MSETLMTDAANTTEGTDASQTASEVVAAANAAENQAGNDQQAAAKAPEGETPAGDQAEASEQGKPEGAPESYEFTAPEGITFDDAVVGAFAEVAKELNLPQEQAQKVLDKMAPVMAARQAEQIAALSTEWAESSKADKEFGGEALSENLALAVKARDTFASPELVQMLNETRLGNNPEVIRLFYRVGKAVSEDSFVSGKGSNSHSETIAQRMYPGMNP